MGNAAPVPWVAAGIVAGVQGESAVGRYVLL